MSSLFYTRFNLGRMLGKSLLFLLVVLSFFFSNTRMTFAATPDHGPCSDLNLGLSSNLPGIFIKGDASNKLTISATNLVPGRYRPYVTRAIFGTGLLWGSDEASVGGSTMSTDASTAEFTLSGPLYFANTGEHIVYLQKKISETDDSPEWTCFIEKYEVSDAPTIKNGSLKIYQTRNADSDPAKEMCYYKVPNGCIKSGSDSVFIDAVLMQGRTPLGNQELKAELTGPATASDQRPTKANGEITFVLAVSQPGAYTLTIAIPKWLGFWNQVLYTQEIKIGANCNDPTECNSTETIIETPSTAEDLRFSLCDQIPSSMSEERENCIKCTENTMSEDGNILSENDKGIWTAVGCIKNEPTSLIASLVQLGLGIAGGVALLIILAAGFMLTTSQGEPKRVGEAKEMITSAIIGLLFIIFSVTILQFIGFNILKIPGFGG
jgi:hypothetical protein